MSLDQMELVQLAVMILLPIVPAYLLFKALPSQATVTGPLEAVAAKGFLRGLNVKLTGAFAGYFAVLIIVFGLHHIWHPDSPYEVWHVQGKLRFENGSPRQLMETTEIETAPVPILAKQASGSFDVWISTKPGPGGGVEFPNLTIGNPNYEPVTIPLDDLGAPPQQGTGTVKLDRDEKQHHINIDVQLKRIPPYSVAAATVPIQVQESRP